jgi:hypothetical protein
LYTFGYRTPMVNKIIYVLRVGPLNRSLVRQPLIKDKNVPRSSLYLWLKKQELSDKSKNFDVKRAEEIEAD